MLFFSMFMATNISDPENQRLCTGGKQAQFLGVFSTDTCTFNGHTSRASDFLILIEPVNTYKKVKNRAIFILSSAYGNLS